MKIKDFYTSKTKDIHTSVVSSDPYTHVQDIETAQLAHLISVLAPHEGTVDLSKYIPRLHVSRYSYITPDTIKTFFSTSLIIVAQGAKAITIENSVFSTDDLTSDRFAIGYPYYRDQSFAPLS